MLVFNLTAQVCAMFLIYWKALDLGRVAEAAAVTLYFATSFLLL